MDSWPMQLRHVQCTVCLLTKSSTHDTSTEAIHTVGFLHVSGIRATQENNAETQIPDGWLRHTSQAHGSQATSLGLS